MLLTISVNTVRIFVFLILKTDDITPLSEISVVTGITMLAARELRSMSVVLGEPLTTLVLGKQHT
jgi:hypothetical protein